MLLAFKTATLSNDGNDFVILTRYVKPTQGPCSLRDVFCYVFVTLFFYIFYVTFLNFTFYVTFNLNLFYVTLLKAPTLVINAGARINV